MSKKYWMHEWLACVCCLTLGPIAVVSAHAQSFLDETHAGHGLALQITPQLSALAALSPTSMPAPTPADTHAANMVSQWPALLRQAAAFAPTNRAAAAGLAVATSQSKQRWIESRLPRLDTAASRRTQSQTYNGQNSRNPSSSLSVVATLPLWRGSARAQADAQAALTEQARWQGHASQQETARLVSEAYLEGLQTLLQQRLTQARLASLQKQLQINDKRMAGGIGTVLDVLQTRTQIEQSLADLQTLDSRLLTQTLQIERLSGQPAMWPDAHAVWQGRIPVVSVIVPNLPTALQQALQDSPAVAQTRAQEQAAEATIRARQREQWQPTVDLVGQVERSRSTAQFDGLSEDQQVRSRSIGVELNWPLFTSGLQEERSKEAAAQLVQAQAQMDDVHAQTEADMRNTYRALDEALALTGLQRTVADTAQSSLAAVNKAFAAGIRDNSDVLDAQLQVHLAQQQLVSAAFTSVAAQVRILALLGQLDAASVAPLAQLFSPSPALAQNATP